MALLDGFLTPDKLAAELGVNARTIDRWSQKRDGLPFHRIGKRRLYRRATVEAWIDAQERCPNPARGWKP